MELFELGICINHKLFIHTNHTNTGKYVNQILEMYENK